MFLLTYNTVTSEDTGKMSLLYFVVISIPLVIIGYFQLILGTANHFSNYWGQQYDRIYSTFAHPNQFAFYLAVIIFALLLIVQKRILTRISLIYCGIITVAILLTYSRAVWLCIGVCVAGIMISSRRLWFPAIIGCLCLVFLLSPIIRTGMKDTIDPNLGQRNSVDMRLEITKSLLTQAFAKKPFLGFGLGTSEQLVKKYTKYQELPPHNDYIRVLVETGALGCLVFILYLVFLFVLPLKRPQLLITNVYLRIYNLMVLFLAVIIAATNHIGNVSTMGMWFALLGIIYKLLQLSRQTECA